MISYSTYPYKTCSGGLTNKNTGVLDPGHSEGSLSQTGDITEHMLNTAS